MEWSSKNKVVYGPRREYSQNKSRNLVFFFCALIIFLAVIFYGAYWITAHPKFTIKNVSVNGIIDMPEIKIREAIDEYLNSEFFMGLLRRQYFFAGGHALESVIREKFPRIKKVTVKVILPDKLSVFIEERAIWGTLCGYIVDANASTTQKISKITSCSYIDANGFAFETAPELYGFLTKKIYSDGEITPGKQIIPQEHVLFYDAMQAIFASLAIPLTRVEFSQELPRDARIYSGNWFAIVAKDAYAQKIKEVLKPLLDTELKGKLNLLQYIDLRFGNKVFYKFTAEKLDKK